MQDESWKARGLCTEVVMSGGTDLWFPPEPGDPDYKGGPFPGGGQIVKRYNQARKICDRCPVKAECLSYALAEEIPHGMWGGQSPAQRGVDQYNKYKKAS